MEPGAATGPGRAAARELLPVLVAALLAWPGLFLGYVWDDFLFLKQVPIRSLRDLLPDPSAPFYRPVSRQLYFTLLAAAGPAGAIVGHLVNLLLLAAVVLLLARLAARLAGPPAGTVAGLAFAALGVAPFLVAWVSGAQDLLAMLFLLAALHLELSGRSAAAWVAAALAVLSKETAALALPALALLPWVLGRGRGPLARAAIRYGAIAALWAVVHSGVHHLASSGSLVPGEFGYDGLRHPGHWLPFAGRYLLTLLNVPISRPAAVAAPRLLAAIPALALAALALLAWRPAVESAARPSRPRTGRVLLFCALLALPALLASAMIIRACVPYYAAFPALGTSIALGLLLGPRHAAVRVAFLAAFLAAGVWARGAPLPEDFRSEDNLRATSDALRRVEAGLRTLHPGFPPRSRLLIAVNNPNTRRVYFHVYYYQAPRIWYQDRTLRSMRPDWREAGAGPEYLLFVEPDFSVREVDRATLAVRPEGAAWDRASYRIALRLYARGLAATGDAATGAALLLRAPEPDPEEREVNGRLAAMLRLYAGDRADAAAILQGLPPIPRETALACVTTALENPPGAGRWDEPALEAFGLSPGDPDVCRSLIQNFTWGEREEPARRFAERLLRLRPGDPDGIAALRYAEGMRPLNPFTMPRPEDSPPGPAR